VAERVEVEIVTIGAKNPGRGIAEAGEVVELIEQVAPGAERLDVEDERVVEPKRPGQPVGETGFAAAGVAGEKQRHTEPEGHADGGLKVVVRIVPGRVPV
jgi:hypothetical protein